MYVFSLSVLYYVRVNLLDSVGSLTRITYSIGLVASRFRKKSGGEDSEQGCRMISWTVCRDSLNCRTLCHANSAHAMPSTGVSRILVML